MLGYAVVEPNGRFHHCGSVTLVTKESKKATGWQSLALRMKMLDDWVWHFFDRQVSVTAVGIEHPWYGKNLQTALTLGIAFGYVSSEAQRRGYAVFKISPAEAKRALAGKGNADKQQMIAGVKTKIGLTVSADEADAIGVALATLEKC